VKRSLSVILMLTLMVGLVFLSTPARASVLGSTVNTTSDAPDANLGDGKCGTSVAGQCSLRAAIQQANFNGSAVNTINIPSGTYYLNIAGSGEDSAASGDLDLRVNTKLMGSATAPTIVLGDAGFGDRIFDVPAGTAPNVEFHELTISGGSAPGSEDGGGFRYQGTGNLKIIDTAFDGNIAGGSGGGLYQGSGTADLSITTFNNNQAALRGGGMDMEGSVVTTNSNHLTWTNNTALQGGGLAAFVAAGATGSIPFLDMSSAIANHTTAGGAGGGMAVSRIWMTHIDLMDNTATFGGGIELVGTSKPSTLTGRIVISGNSATDFGGGLYTTACNISCGSLLHVVLEGNSAGKEGSGMYVKNGLTVEKSTVNANTTGGQGVYGGAVYHAGTATGPLILTNMTVGENVNGPVAGGIMLGSSARDVFNSVTIGNNTGGTANGIAVTATGKLPQIHNSIVSGTGTMCNRKLMSLGYNLDRGATCGFTKIGDMRNKDPLLAPLADNGGGTHTMRIPGGSPAIDKGDPNICPIYDQRSGRRPWDQDGNGTVICDIGAFELGPTSLNVDVGFIGVTSSVVGVTVTYTLDLHNVGAWESKDTLLTDILPSSLALESCDSTVRGECGGSGNTVTVTFGSIALTETPRVTIIATIIGSGKIDTPLSVWSENTDWYPTDNNALASIQV
jgi:CSLREA domain-containing protein/uncharacterized repeat protein (TIGR01451 family)